MRRFRQVVQGRSLGGVQARFLVFVVFAGVVCLPPLLLADDASSGGRLLGVAGIGWLLASRYREYVRGGLAAPGWDLVDAAAFAAAATPAGPLQVIPLFFSSIYFRALFGGGARLTFSLFLYGVAFAVGGVLAPAGVVVPTDLVASTMLGGLVVGYLMHTLRTSLTSREAALRREHEAVVTSERFLAAVLNNITDGVVACDSAGRVTVLNDAAGALHPQAGPSVPPEAWAPAGGLYEADGVTLLPADQVPLRRVLAGEQVTETEVVVAAGDGSRRVVLASGQPILDERDGRTLGAVVTLHDITARREAEHALVHQSLHDALTGLPNRVLLADRFDRALRSSRRAGTATGLLLIDLDRFKDINDTFGHHYGDAVLTQIGPRLAGALREVDTVARLGGDEFVVLLPEVEGVQAALVVAEKLREALQAPFQVDGIDLNVEASVGVVVSGEHGEDAGLLLQRADIAMYLAKGRSLGVASYDPAADEHSPQRLALLGELRRAMTRHELVLHYQPKVSLSTGDVVGVEALVRWQHPTRGLIAPDAFIPLAEHTGLIGPLTRYVLDHVLAQARAWMNAGRPLPIAVNLSARNLLDDRLADHVADLLSTHQVPARLLELEVTETAIITEPTRAQQLLHRLSELGVRLAIDDFGAGYTSLGQLKNLPVTELKIDRSFVTSMTHDRGNALIVASVVELGHNLGLTAVAEGVETAETMTALAGCGCDVAQGRYLSSPLPPATFDTWYTTTHTRTKTAARPPAAADPPTPTIPTPASPTQPPTARQARVCLDQPE